LISLKKHIEADWKTMLESSLGAYRTLLAATADAAAKALPHLGSSLQQSLLNLNARLEQGVTPVVVAETREMAKEALTAWSTGTSEYIKEKAAEVKDLMLTVVKTAESLGDRDQRYAARFNRFSAQLEAIATLEDISRIRISLTESAADLKAGVSQMAEENQSAVAALRQELAVYQTRLDEAEQRASLDPLTGLVNRREVEKQVRRRIDQKRAFCMMMFDLNNFKQVNDQHGHLAGDEVLKLFSTELRGAIRSTDVAGRWGGDEFLVILDCGLVEAKNQVGRIKEWVFGNYTVKREPTPLRVHVEAAVGLIASKPDETLEEMLARADATMYKEKAGTAQNKR
jgi:diguanylate cyclase (GGDEF)-like protein